MKLKKKKKKKDRGYLLENLTNKDSKSIRTVTGHSLTQTQVNPAQSILHQSDPSDVPENHLQNDLNLTLNDIILLYIKLFEKH